MMLASLQIPITTDDFIRQLRQRGVELSADADVLRVSAPKGVVDTVLAAEISSRKPAILEYLQAAGESDPSIAEHPGIPQPTISRAGRTGPLPLGFVQQRMWLHNQLEPDTVLYNLPAAWRLTGVLDTSMFQQAFAQVVARHEVLQVAIAAEDGQPVQRLGAVAGAADADSGFEPGDALTLEDLSGLPAAERESVLASRLAALRDEAIDLGAGRPFRAALFRMAADEHVFFLLPHHVVWDGWSFDIFLRDFGELYGAALDRRPASLPTLPIQYIDYAIWHRDWLGGGELDAQLAYWDEALADAPTTLDLPLDFPRPRRFTHRGDWEEFAIPAITIERINRLAARHRGTSFMVLLAAWSAFLQRITGQHDIVVGVPIQARQDPQVSDLIGCFVNTLCLRSKIDPEASFEQLIDDVRDTSLGAYEHQDTPVDLLIERFPAQRDVSRTPLFQTMFSHQQVSRRPARLGALAVSQVHVNPAATPTDLMLAVMEGASGARGVLHYSTDLFAASTIRRMRLRFEQFLDAALDDPALALHALPMVTPQEREATLNRWNATTRDVATHATASELLGSASWRGGAAPALRFGSGTLSYAQLDARVNRLARLLRDRGARRGALVGLCVERSPAMLVALLAILRSGAAWVPLDPAYPAERLTFMARDAQLALLVTEADKASILQWPRERSIWLDAEHDAIESCSEAPLPRDADCDARPQDPAYVIYTSGSTGEPKGVVIAHRALVNFLGSMASEPGLNADDRLLAVTTLSFDISILELLLPLARGAQVILASREQAMDAVALRALLESSRATIMQATPVTWQLLVDAGWQGSAGFKALVGGETLPVPLARQLLERTGELWNMYGPTETTVWSTCWKVQPPTAGPSESGASESQPLKSATSVPIGRPIANTQIHVLDDHQQLCPVGVPGELCIGGDGVALGYLQRPQLTTQRFIADPFADRPAATLYRTGDRGRWLANGTLEHLGRLDFQVKVRGHRIEPGEIEAQLLTHPGVARAAVVVREDRPGDVRLVAYLASDSNAALPDEHAMRAHLKASLPAYMIPQHVVALDSLPLTPNGKIDRKALPAPSPVGTSTEDFIAPRNELERKIAEAMAQVLDAPRIGIDDDFFDLGGHSLLAVQLFHRIHRATGVNLPLAALLNGSTVRALASVFSAAGTLVSDASGVDPESEGHIDPWAPLVAIRDGKDQHGEQAELAPLFLVHAVGGNVLNYRRLAAAMPPGPPIYGLQALGLDGLTTPLTRVEDMATLYIRELRTVQPNGPYHLAGGSMGGIIAYEMAQQLIAAGDKVALLALMDTAVESDEQHFLGRLGRLWAQWRDRFGSDARPMSASGLLTRVEATAAMRVRLLARKCRVALARHSNTRLPHSVRYAEVEAAHRQAYREYQAQPYPGAVVLFRAKIQGPDSEGGPALGWDRLAGEVEVIPLSGDHGAVVEAPELPRLLDSAFHSSQARKTQAVVALGRPCIR